MNPMQILMSLMQSGGNPQMIAQQMMNKNPQLRAIFNQMNQSGMQPAQFLQQYAKQNNIDLRPFQEMARKKGVRF